MKQLLFLKAIALFIIAQCFSPYPSLAQTICAINVNQAQIINPNSKQLLGISFDGRSSGDFNAGPLVDPIGYFDPATGDILPAVEPSWSRMPVGGVRYPGNLEVLNWNWSYTIGPYASRVPQPIGPNGTSVQTLQFGFDEFMDAMTVGKGLPTDAVQIMVNLYASVGQPDPAVLAADWVEYCNTPNNGSNPRGGIDWAMLRASYGHPAPYGIRIWNIGNEPWQPGELGNTAAGATTYIGLATPIIDSMLSVDPTLDITVAAVGNSTSPWNSTLLASTGLMSRIYGFSSHAFYDEDPATGNPTVSQAEVLLTNLAAAAAAQGKKVISGDHAAFAPSNDPDKAMRWEGALQTGNMLLMLSQINNIELANFWIYGNVKGVWHPIRQNANGTYTFMAVAQLYEKFDAFFYEQSLATTVANASGGGTVPNVRAASFKSNDGTKASVIVANTNLSVDREVIPPSLSGFALHNVKKMTAPTPSSDTSTTTVVSPLANGNYSLQHASILMFEYQDIALGVEFIEPFKVFAIGTGVQVEWATVSEKNSSHFEVERSNDAIKFMAIGKVKASGNSTFYQAYNLYDEHPYLGTNYYRIRQVDRDGANQYSRVLYTTCKPLDVKIFPSPASSNIYLDLPHDMDFRVEMFDQTGRMVLSEQNAINLNVGNLPDGRYLLRITNKDANYFRYLSVVVAK